MAKKKEEKKDTKDSKRKLVDYCCVGYISYHLSFNSS